MLHREHPVHLRPRARQRCRPPTNSREHPASCAVAHYGEPDRFWRGFENLGPLVLEPCLYFGPTVTRTGGATKESARFPVPDDVGVEQIEERLEVAEAQCVEGRSEFVHIDLVLQKFCNGAAGRG